MILSCRGSLQVAAAALERVLKENRKNKHRYLDALERSPPKILRVDLRGDPTSLQARNLVRYFSATRILFVAIRILLGCFFALESPP